MYVFQPVTQGDITGYQVYYNGTMTTYSSSTTSSRFVVPLLPPCMFTGTIVIIVTAVRGSKVGPASDPATAVLIGKYVYMYVCST